MRREAIKLFLCGALTALTFVALLLSATADRAMIRVAFACAALAEAGSLFLLYLRAAGGAGHFRGNTKCRHFHRVSHGCCKRCHQSFYIDRHIIY